MFIDRVTEDISHFIGLFMLDLEEVRARLALEGFEDRRVMQDLEEVELGVWAPPPTWDLPDFVPEVRDVHFVLTQFDTERLPRLAEPEETATADGTSGAAETSYPDIPNFGFSIGGSMDIALPPLGSVATIVVQFNSLNDNDILGIDPELHAAWMQQAWATFDILSASLAAYSGTALDREGAGDTTFVTGDAAAVHLDATLSSALDAGATIHASAFTADADWFADGIWTDTVMSLSDLAEHYGPHAEEEGGDPRFDPVGGDGAFQGGIAFGNNMALNQAVIVDLWFDAPTIAVGGDVHIVSGIVQTYALTDHDLGMYPGDANLIQNHARIAGQATITEQEGALFSGSLDGVRIATIEGDLLSLSMTHQFNFLSDVDAVSMSFQTGGLLLETGENLLVNTEFLQTFGAGFDLIVVEGDFVQTTWITQMNILVDDDAVIWAGAPGAVGAGSGNALHNSASITLSNDILIGGHEDVAALIAALRDGGDVSALAAAGAASETGGLNILHVKGDLVQAKGIEQTNVMIDSDLLTDITSQFDAEGNLLGNTAEVVNGGVPSVVAAGGEVYSDALIHQAGLVTEDGTDGPVLASEAVVFLADNMLSDPTETEDGLPSDGADGGVPADVMVLAVA